MKVNKYIGVMMVAMVLAASSCTDFDDYNEVPMDANASAEKTLWENISQNASLSNFQSIIKKVGFDAALQQSHFYTVWAPLDGTYDANALLNQDDETVLYRFVKSHVAEYNHLVSGAIDERIHALNDKSFLFEGNGTYKYADVDVAQTNLPSINGVMHTLQGAATFYPNIYEYIFQREGIDSLEQYVKKYETVYLDENNSVVGPTVNGKQTYIDSVMVTTNSLYRTLNARIAHEDSSYTMILPTNEAWVKAYDKIKPYFNYIRTTTAQDIDAAQSQTTIPSTTVTIDHVYMADSLTKLAMMENLFFNNNNEYNRWVENPSAVFTDTLLTTTRNKLSNPREILAKTIDKEKMSNGYARIVDSLAILPWEGWAPELIISPIGRNVSWNGDNHTVVVENPNPAKGTFESGSIAYLWVSPKTNYSKPELAIKLPGVLSTTYNLYCVIVPPDVDPTDTITEVMPNQLDFDLSYCNANGTLAQTWTGTNHTTSKTHFALKLENDPTKVDTMFVGTINFPVAYMGLGEKMYPNLKITSDFSVFSPLMKTYTRDLRIAAIILRPVEKDDYFATKEE